MSDHHDRHVLVDHFYCERCELWRPVRLAWQHEGMCTEILPGHAQPINMELNPIANEDACGNVGPAGGERLKDWEELRHTVSHLWLAIQHIADGAPQSAQRELEACESAIFFNSIDEMRGYDGQSSTEKDEPVQRSKQAPDAAQ